MELKKDKSSKGFRTKVLKFIPQQKIFVLCFSTNKRLHSHDRKQWKMNENHQKSTFFIICMRGACRNKKNKYVYWLLFGVELMHCKKLYVDGFFKTCTMFQSTLIVFFLCFFCTRLLPGTRSPAVGPAPCGVQVPSFQHLTWCPAV